MMKILITTLTLSEKCGLGRYSLDLIGELAKENELIIFTAKQDKELNLSFPNSKIFYIFPGESKIYRIMRPWLFLKYLFKIYPQAKKVDLIHSFMDFPYSFLAVVIGLLSGKPAVSTAHGTYSVVPFFSRRWSGLLRWTYRHLRRVVCISNFTKKEILRKINIENCITINNGINLDKFNIDETRNQPEADQPLAGRKQATKGRRDDSSSKMILSVGMLKQRKGFHVSLKAVAQVKEKYPNLRYYIVGRQEDKNYFEKLKQIVKDYNLENSVVFLENISDRELKKLYNQADLFLLTPVYIKGNFEGFGLVYLEAGAFGKPVVGSLGSGAEEAVVHNETGLLVPQNDPKATAEATIKILGNPELAKKLGQGNKNFTKDHDWERVAKKYQEIYKKFAS